ncbi:hypothetical protein HMPREF1155_1447 [Slackia sp. CM382]|nr:hypothetical protein HMPREF1155_1447 [Slackia sp. CM382]
MNHPETHERGLGFLQRKLSPLVLSASTSRVRTRDGQQAKTSREKSSSATPRELMAHGDARSSCLIAARCAELEL